MMSLVMCLMNHCTMAKLRKIANDLMDVYSMPEFGKHDREVIGETLRIISDIIRKKVNKPDFNWTWMPTDNNVVFVVSNLIRLVLDALYRNFNFCTFIVDLTYKNYCKRCTVNKDSWIINKHILEILLPSLL